MNEVALLTALGTRVRGVREAAGLTLAELANDSGLSRRYLTELEAGRANISILKLAGVAQALRHPLAALCDLSVASDVKTRIALVGLRGAGKSTIGKALALELEYPFVELDRRIEENSGLDLGQVFGLHGEPYYRRLEGEALEEHLASSAVSVLATGGSIVTHDETWSRLLESCFVVWLATTPEEHWRRVVAQGDTRPMHSNPRAMDELHAILESRRPLYAGADLEIDTTNRPPEDIVQEIVAAL